MVRQLVYTRKSDMTHLSCITDHIANPEDMKALSSFQKSVNTQYPTANQRILFPVKEEK